MKTSIRFTMAIACISGISVAQDRSSITVLGAFHDQAKETIVFSVHYLRNKNARENVIRPNDGAYIKINDRRYPIHRSDSFSCGSQTGRENIIDEYIVSGYRVQGESKEIPGLKNCKTIIFGLDYEVNHVSVKVEKKLPVFMIETKKAEQDAAPAGNKPSK